MSSSSTSTKVGKVLEILADAHAGKVLGTLIQEYTVGNADNPYHLPSVSPMDGGPAFCQLKVNCSLISLSSGSQLITYQYSKVLSTVSTIHNCAAHHCTITRTRSVTQERQQTDLLDDEITHSESPDD